MISIHSSAGLLRLDQAIQSKFLCAFDFDGTLAPITDNPWETHLPSDLAIRLDALRRLAPIAVITGRSMADIRKRLPFEPHFLVANHGLEGLPGADGTSRRYEDVCRGWLEKLTAALDGDRQHDPGIWIEPKGVTLSIHYRMARNPAQCERRLRELISAVVEDACVVGGKQVLNLLPKDAGNKGQALEVLMQTGGFESAMYVGDDLTDEDVFRLQRSDILSVRVGRSLDSSAKFFIDDQAEIAQLIDEIIMRLRVSHHKNHESTANADRTQSTLTPSNGRLADAARVSGEA